MLTQATLETHPAASTMSMLDTSENAHPVSVAYCETSIESIWSG
jgi:hypothetical protein